MVQIVCCKMGILRTHWEQGNLFGQITVGIPINESYLIAVIQQVRPIVGERRLNTLTLVNDAVVFHLEVGRGLEIDPAFIAPVRAAENVTQISVKSESSFQCRHPQSSRSALDTGLPPWSLSISCPRIQHNVSGRSSDRQMDRRLC